MKRENVESYLKDQYAKDRALIKRPKEVLFLGAANNGKSSLINAVLRKDVCRVSHNPVS